MLKRLERFSQTRPFWIIQVFAFFICTYVAIHLYPVAFPIVDLKITMDRTSALAKAKVLAEKAGWGPEKFRQSASFDLDQQTQTFVELTEGGSAGFGRLLSTGFYFPYQWKVRHFSEGHTEEAWIRFTPRGDFYGFTLNVPESQPGPALSQEEALKIAESRASQDWGVALSEYQLIEKSHEAQPSHRVDHTFVYERKNASIGKDEEGSVGHYRLQLAVSGDRLTEIRHFIQIPNAFLRKYSEMRSANNTISMVSNAAMAILYILGGCGLGIFLLARKHWVIWKKPVIFAIIVAAFQALEALNQFPLSWMRYDTALSSSGFILQTLAMVLIQFLSECFLLSISFMAAESLSRRAFPHHPQLWRIWKTDNASSVSILGRTLGGYLSVGFFFLFVVTIYIVGTRYFGWWGPSDTLFQPDGLATLSPWFTSVSNSLHAGFWEECLFRAVPIASAALLGVHFGGRKKWIAAGFVVQALIFAAAHANYPAQPSYARVVELIIPSFIFGGIYLVFGLLPGIILHYTFDVVSFSIPLFATSTPRIWADRLLVIAFSLLPLWIVLFARWKKGRWTQIAPEELNAGWQPSIPAQSNEDFESHHPVRPLSKTVATLLTILAAAGLVLWLFVIQFPNDAPPLNVSKEQAIQLSRNAIEKEGIHLTPEWRALASTAEELGEDDRFIWRTAGPAVYHSLMGNYLSPPSWIVRYVRFDVNVAERAEEYQVFISRNGNIDRIRHELPEGRKGADLPQEKARQLALSELEKRYSLHSNQIKEVSSNASQLPQRKDWVFVFSDPSITLKEGEARIAVRVAGEQVAAYKKFIFIPEEWSRKERNTENLIHVIRMICYAASVLLILSGIIYSLVSWTKKKFDTRTFKLSWTLLFVLGLISFVNELPTHLAQFSTVEPLLNQWITLLLSEGVKLFAMVTCYALLLGRIHHYAISIKIKPLGFSKPWLLLLGYSLGIVMTVGLASITRFLPRMNPIWGTLSGITTWVPALEGIEVIERYVVITLFLFLIQIYTLEITRRWTQKQVLGSLFLLVTGFMSSGIIASSPIHFGVFGLLGGIFLIIASRFFIQTSLALIPLASASLLMLQQWREIAMRPYLGIETGATLAILLLVIAGRFWHTRLLKTQDV